MRAENSQECLSVQGVQLSPSLQGHQVHPVIIETQKLSFASFRRIAASEMQTCLLNWSVPMHFIDYMMLGKSIPL